MEKIKTYFVILDGNEETICSAKDVKEVYSIFEHNGRNVKLVRQAIKIEYLDKHGVTNVAFTYKFRLNKEVELIKLSRDFQRIKHIVNTCTNQKIHINNYE